MNQKPIQQSIDPRLIRTDLNTQAREKTCEDTVREYTESMENGTRFPPITVFLDLENDFYILADGFHRLFAHLRAKPNDPIIVEQYLGDYKDALRYAVCANQSHGLKRTYGDKRKAIERYMLELDGAEESDGQIARNLGVVQSTVSRIRKKLQSEGRLMQCMSRVGVDGRTYDVSHVGKKPDVPYFCADCGHYKSPRCLIEGEMREPTHPCCEEFVRLQHAEPVEEEETTDDDDPRLQREHVPKEVRHRVSRRKPGEYVEVPLSKTNTDLAAAEIRHYFDDNYLAALVQSALKILKD